VYVKALLHIQGCFTGLKYHCHWQWISAFYHIATEAPFSPICSWCTSVHIFHCLFLCSTFTLILVSYSLLLYLMLLLNSCLQTCMTYTIAECTVNKLQMTDRGTVRNV